MISIARLIVGALFAVLAFPALAQSWPQKPVRLIVSLGAGWGRVAAKADGRASRPVERNGLLQFRIAFRRRTGPVKSRRSVFPGGESRG